MSRPVFISYARSASAAEAQALADRLGDLAFLDTGDIEDGADFPQRLLDGVLDAHVVVIFATKSYPERRFCRLEMRLALAGCNTAATQIVLALGDGSNSVLDAMPAAVADQSWPAATEPERLNALVRERLRIALNPIRGGLATEEARKLAAAFLDQSMIPEPLYQQMSDRGLSPRTVQGAHWVLNAAFRQASQWEMILDVPTKGVKLPRIRRHEMQVFSVEQAKLFLKFALPTMYGTLFAIAVTTGMRPASTSASSGRTLTGNVEPSV